MESNLDKIFKTSKSVEKSGVWFNIDDKTGFLMKPFKPSNPSIKAAMAVHYKPYARQVQLETIEDEKGREIMIKVLVQACLINWKGVMIDGVEVAFSKDLAIDFLKGLPELFETLMEYASDFRNYKEEFPGDANDLGNS